MGDDTQTPRHLIEGILMNAKTQQSILPYRSRVVRTPNQNDVRRSLRSHAKTASASKRSCDDITPRSMIQSYMETHRTVLPSQTRTRRRRSTPALSAVNIPQFTPRTNIEGLLGQAPEETPFLPEKRRRSSQESLSPLPANMTINMPVDNVDSFQEEISERFLRTGRKKILVKSTTPLSKRANRSAANLSVNESLHPIPDNLDIDLPDLTMDVEEDHYTGPTLRSGKTPSKSQRQAFTFSVDRLSTRKLPNKSSKRPSKYESADNDRNSPPASSSDTGNKGDAEDQESDDQMNETSDNNTSHNSQQIIQNHSPPREPFCDSSVNTPEDHMSVNSPNVSSLNQENQEEINRCEYKAPGSDHIYDRDAIRPYTKDQEDDIIDEEEATSQNTKEQDNYSVDNEEAISQDAKNQRDNGIGDEEAISQETDGQGSDGIGEEEAISQETEELGAGDILDEEAIGQDYENRNSVDKEMLMNYNEIDNDEERKENYNTDENGDEDDTGDYTENYKLAKTPHIKTPHQPMVQTTLQAFMSSRVSQPPSQPRPSITSQPPAQQRPSITSQPPAQQRPSITSQPPAQQRPSITSQPPAQQRPSITSQPPAQQRPSITSQPPAQPRPSITSQPPAQQRPSITSQPPAQQRPSITSQPPAQQRPSITSQPPAQQRPSITSQPPAQQRPSITSQPPAQQQIKRPRKKRDLPTCSLRPNLVKQIFQHFCRMKVSTDVLPELINITEKYFEQVAADLEAYCEHAGRKTIEASDVELLMKRQGFITEKQSLNGIVEKLLPLELRQEIIPVARSGNIVTPL